MHLSRSMLAVRRLLDDGQEHTGAELARRLGLSRSTVSRCLRQAREWGYAIDRPAGRGFRLAGVPDLPLPWEIALRLGERGASRLILFYPVVGSTNDVARTLAHRRGAPSGTLVVADRQTRGRGRQGRPWHSPPGGLYLSVVERPRFPSSRAPVLSLAAALAAAVAVEAGCGVRVGVKWPNDLVVGDRKLGGILAELEAQGRRIRWVVFGIGVNIAPPWPAGEPPDSGAPCGERPPGPGAGALAPVSLAELGCRAPRAALAAGVVRELEANLRRLEAEGPRAARQLLEAVEARLVWKGRSVRVKTGSETVEGVLLGLDASGALVVQEASGRSRTVFAGDVSLRPAA